MISKEALRKKFRQIRKSLSLLRREEAKNQAFIFLQTRLAFFSSILSFAPTEEEIDLWPLNSWLCKEKKFFLPKVQKKELIVYRVKHLPCDLTSHPPLFIKEPKNHCEQIPLSQIDCILVPAIAFDIHRYRLGYGMGFYDRLLAQSHAYSIGIGFKEQMNPAPLPIESYDQPLSEIALF